MKRLIWPIVIHFSLWELEHFLIEQAHHALTLLT